MSNTNNMNLDIINQSDTIRDFMKKCNDNFSKLSTLSGPAGIQGEQGEQGVPTKPKVSIHAWTKGVEYINDDNYTISVNGNELTDSKYQEGHLIILENAHVYVLEIEDNSLTPRFKIALQSYEQGSVIDGKNAYVHFAYADNVNGANMIIPNQNYQAANAGEESISTFSLTRAVSNNNSNISEKPYMGMYCSRSSEPSTNPDIYTWVRIRGRDGDVGSTGPQGPEGPEGPQGPEGSPFSGQNYTIDLQGDMAMVSLNIDRTIQNQSSSCKCTIYAYYGDENVELNLTKDKVSFIVDENGYVDKDLNYKISLNKNNELILWANDETLGVFTISQNNKDVDIEFKPENTFIFPETTLIFPIQINSTIEDGNDGKTYNFTRKTIWSIKGIVSNFSLEIVPQYRTIKLSDGTYTPNILKVDVFKLEDGKRTLFILNENPNYELLYKNYSSNTWNKYKDENNGNGVSTENVSCLEFKLVKNYQSTDPNNIEEIWDYENVWVVSDGKSAHYYHADLGNMESMMVVTTGRQIEVETENGTVYYAEFKDKSEYSIIFYPQLFDGTTKCDDITYSVSIGSNSGETYYTDGSFIRELKMNDNGDWQLTVARVPYGVDVIPMNIVVEGKLPNSTETITDSVPFNIYISTISDIYTIETTPTIYNTSTGENGDKIECKVFKNNTLIETENLGVNGLILEYTIYGEGNKKNEPLKYDEPIVYGIDDDIKKDNFTASDVAIEFTLYYIKPDVNQEILKATVPLIKDGKDGADGYAWQYIFCRSTKYPFNKTEISDPSGWINAYDVHDHIEEFKNSDAKYFGEYEENYITEKDKFVWYDDHQGVNSEFKYEYQSYRKWDKTNKCWGKYTSPTLYSNYSESGSGYSVLLSNPVAVIPVGDDWSTDENSGKQGDSTLVYLYNNTSNISTNPNITIEISLDKTDVNYKFFEVIEGNKVTFTPKVGEDVFTFTENTPYKLPIDVKYDLKVDNDNDGISDCFTTTINWTLTPIKGLEDIEVFVDHRVINTSRNNTDNIRVGYYISSSNGGKKFVGESSQESNINNYQIKITNNLNDIINVDAVSDWRNVSYSFTNGNYYVVLVKSDGETIIDYTTITTVSDGESTIHLVLSQDYIALPHSSNGNIIHEDYNEPIELRMLLYNGNNLIEYNNVTYKFYIGDNQIQNDHISKNDNNFFIKIEGIKDYINEGGTNIICEAIYNGVSYSKILFVELKETPYELEFNKNVLTRSVNSNKITDVSLVARVKYWINGGWIYTTTGVLKAIVGVSEEYEFTTSIDGSDKRILYIANAESNLKNYTGDNIRISYYDNNVEQTYEILDIINGEYIDKKQYIYCNSPYNPWKSDGDLGLVDPTTISATGGYNDYDTEGRWSPLRPGVDSDNKYEYMSERSWDKSTNKWGNYHAPVLISTYAENGSTPEAPVCTSISIIGYSLKELSVDSNEWVGSLNNLGTIDPGKTIYMLNEYTWEQENETYKTKSITFTLAGTQGVEGKSRVLFYLGSFENDDTKGITPTLVGKSVEGKLTNDRCDYYIDADGHAWMRTGTAETATGYANGNNNSSEWLISEKVGFLQANAITADMINTESLVTDYAFISKLTVNAANITGTLTIGGGSDSDNCVIIDGVIPNDNIPMISGTKIEDGAITTDKIATNAITAGKIDVTAIYSDIITAGKGEIETIVADKISVTNIAASQINTDELVVKKLNTMGTTDGKRIIVEDDDIYIYDTNDTIACQLTNAEIGQTNLYNMLEDSNISLSGFQPSISGINFYGGTSTSNYKNNNSTLCYNGDIGIFQKGGTISFSGKLAIYDLKLTGGSTSNVANVRARCAVEILCYDKSVTTLYSSRTSGVTIQNNSSNIDLTLDISDISYTIDTFGFYKYKVYYIYEWGITAWANRGSYGSSSTDSFLNITLKTKHTNKPSSHIFTDGAIFINKNGGFAINNESVMMKSGDARIILENGSVYISFDSQTTPKKIGSTKRTFHTDGTDVTLTVLTLLPDTYEPS